VMLMRAALQVTNVSLLLRQSETDPMRHGMRHGNATVAQAILCETNKGRLSKRLTIRVGTTIQPACFHFASLLVPTWNMLKWRVGQKTPKYARYAADAQRGRLPAPAGSNSGRNELSCIAREECDSTHGETHHSDTLTASGSGPRNYCSVARP